MAGETLSKKNTFGTKSILSDRDKISVYTVLFHVIQHSHPVFCSIQTGYGIGIPTHVGENHHHITACATHVIGYEFKLQD